MDYLRSLYHYFIPPDNNPPKILIRISPSSPVLRKNHPEPFTLTLTARTSTAYPVTIDAFQTLLGRDNALVLDEQGFTFEDTSGTGEFAARQRLCVLVQRPERLPEESVDVVEIPARNAAGQGYRVRHTMRKPEREMSEAIAVYEGEMSRMVSRMFDRVGNRCGDAADTAEDGNVQPPTSELFDEGSKAVHGDQTVGLLPGREYRVGLGTGMSRVNWWRKGRKADVFRRGSLSTNVYGPQPVEMVLMNDVTFTVVDGDAIGLQDEKGYEMQAPEGDVRSEKAG